MVEKWAENHSQDATLLRNLGHILSKNLRRNKSSGNTCLLPFPSVKKWSKTKRINVPMIGKHWMKTIYGTSNKWSFLAAPFFGWKFQISDSTDSVKRIQKTRWTCGNDRAMLPIIAARQPTAVALVGKVIWARRARQAVSFTQQYKFQVWLEFPGSIIKSVSKSVIELWTSC